MAVVISASVRFKTESEGGFYKDPISGIQPSFAVKNDSIISIVTSGTDGVFTRGSWYIVSIELPYGERFVDDIVAGFKFHLNVGRKIIADGEVLSIISVVWC